MRRVATKGTAPERRVRAVTRRLGIRHTTQTSRLPGKPDLVLQITGLCRKLVVVSV